MGLVYHTSESRISIVQIFPTGLIDVEYQVIAYPLVQQNDTDPLSCVEKQEYFPLSFSSQHPCVCGTNLFRP